MNLSIIAIAISALSLLVSIWALLRDRSRLKILSVFYPGHDAYGPPGIKFKAINKGQRPIYIRSIGGDLKGGGWQSTHIGEVEFGKKLEENQYIEEFWKEDDLVAEAPDCTDRYISIWLEDSLGIRHKVPKSKQYIKRLESSNN